MVDVLCIGHAAFDLIFEVPTHPGPDEKAVADAMLNCGGGPAANAAVQITRLGGSAAFAGYLGTDLHGDRHLAELKDEGVDVSRVIRGENPTPVSVILVKPDGKRSLVNYRGATRILPATAVDWRGLAPRVVLFDGHEPELSRVENWPSVPTLLDAGSLHRGTEDLMFKVDCLACSEKFARQWLGADDPEQAMSKMAVNSPCVVVTLGERGLIWRRGSEFGSLPAFPLRAIDTTGAGDAFHGALALALARSTPWTDALRHASAAGALCCTRMGARTGLANALEVSALLNG